jgi:hypothetical protein
VVDKGSNSAGPGSPEAGDPVAGTLRGVVRVLAYEHPALRTTLVDLDADDAAAAALTIELASSSTDDVVAWRAGRRFVERLARAAEPVLELLALMQKSERQRAWSPQALESAWPEGRWWHRCRLRQASD